MIFNPIPTLIRAYDASPVLFMSAVVVTVILLVFARRHK